MNEALLPPAASPAAARLAMVRARMNAALAAADRAPGSALLVAVSKFQSAEAVQDLIAAGQSVFGENRVQEAQAKFTPLRAAGFSGQLHLIGPLQTNKALAAVKLFDVIETLDRPELAAALARAMAQTGRTPRLFVEVNLGREPQKAGLFPEALPAFLDEVRTAHRLSPVGLMAIPPAGLPPAPFFAQLAALAKTHTLPEISMGMSADFDEALAQGATEIRVGTLLFPPAPGRRGAIPLGPSATAGVCG